MFGKRAVFPAYAGMILSPALSVISNGSVPRVCGDDPRGIKTMCRAMRSVPRVCGDDPAGKFGKGFQIRVFPAYAGMIP